MIKDSLYGPHSAVLTAFNCSSQFQRSPGGRALISCGNFILYILTVYAALCSPGSSCAEHYFWGRRKDGLYTISPTPGNGFSKIQGQVIPPLRVWCDMRGSNGGWLVFQKRTNKSVNFFRNWISYKQGFGQYGHDFWLGNRDLRAITNSNEHVLHIELHYSNGSHVFAEYDQFSVSPRNFTLRVGQYRGNWSDILFFANNSAFSTWDRDNDKVLEACAQQNNGAWWYGTTCDMEDLNSMSEDIWLLDVKKTVMKIKPKRYEGKSMSLLS